jgi:predicted DCC family thiol-disulfide oxidoreductase YuxK
VAVEPLHAESATAAATAVSEILVKRFMPLCYETFGKHRWSWSKDTEYDEGDA